MELKKLKLAAGCGKEGFTLLEVLMSLAILSIGLLGVMGLFVTSIGGNAQGKSVTEASAIAQAKLEYLANSEIFDGLTSIKASEVAANSNRKSDGTTAGGKYNISWKVEPFGAPINRNMREITVSVTWTTKGQPHKVEFSTLRAKT